MLHRLRDRAARAGADSGFHRPTRALGEAEAKSSHLCGHFGDANLGTTDVVGVGRYRTRTRRPADFGRCIESSLAGAAKQPIYHYQTLIVRMTNAPVNYQAIAAMVTNTANTAHVVTLALNASQLM